MEENSDSDQFQNFFEEEATYSRTGGVGRHLVDGTKVAFDGKRGNAIEHSLEELNLNISSVQIPAQFKRVEYVTNNNLKYQKGFKIFLTNQN